MSDADQLAQELERVAERLRQGDLEATEAAELVDHCAELAARLGAELDAQSRAATETEGQERLL